MQPKGALATSILCTICSVKNRSGNKAGSRPSAAGERAALTGYIPQYLAAAGLILRALREQELEFVELTHAENGAVDDVVIGTPNRVDAYQIKWGEYPTSFTFKRLSGIDAAGRSLIGDLFSAQRAIQQRFAACRVVVNLTTCDYPSTNDNCRLSGSETLHFARFLEQVWKPAKAGDLTGVEREAAAWDVLRQATGASQDDFLSFIKDCQLTFGATLSVDDTGGSRDGNLKRDQIRELSELLMNLAIDKREVHHFTRKELLTRLNWSHFFALRNRHEFSVSPAYEEISSPSNALNRALDTLPSGYIFLGGSPGSGKSSLLTRTFEMRSGKERWIRYYAFVPGNPEPGSVRGESENFLHDVTTTLHEAGIISGQSHSDFNRQQLLIRLDSQLQTLGKAFEKQKLRTVLLIDGLDHVPREQRPEVSFLKDLPLPNRVPDGVYIVLGSQTDQLTDIPATVRSAIADDNRRILMEPLSPASVRTVVDRSELSVAISEEQHEKIFSLSQGHPLALALLTNRLREITSADAVSPVLEAAEPYVGDIDALYRSHWDQLDQHSELIALFALLGRLRRHIDLGWLHTFNSSAVMSQLKVRFGHLFLREADGRWFFFHNSFRLFIRRETSTFAAYPADANERELHRQLAQHCSRSPAESPWSWEQLYHLAESGQHDAVVALGTTEYFRNQLIYLRPVEAISQDVRMALKSAGQIKDAVAVLRLALCAAEFAQRSGAIENKEVAGILLRIGDIDAALEHLFEGRELRVTEQDGLNSSRQLLAIQRRSEARRLFELSEPFSAQVKSQGMDGIEAHKSLRAWVEAAIHFRPLDAIARVIRSLQTEETQFPDQQREEQTAQLHAELFFHLARELWASNRDEDAQTIEKLLDTDELRQGWWFWTQVDRWRQTLAQSEPEKSAVLIQSVLARLPWEDLSDAQQTLIAEGLFRSKGLNESLEAKIEGLKQPAAVHGPLNSDNVLHHYIDRFRLNRLLRATGNGKVVTILVPDASKPEGQGGVFFERAVVRIAHIWGDAWRGVRYSSADVRQETSDILRLYDRNRRERHRWHSWYAFTNAAKDLYGLLIEAVSQHGPATVGFLRELFEAEWNSESRSGNWPSDVRRHVILELYDTGVDQEWVESQLKALEPTMLSSKDITERVQECKDHAKAWSRLRRTENAHAWLKKMLLTSFGIGYSKDSQLESWMEWLPELNIADPDGAAARFSWFAAAAHATDAVTDGPAARDAVTKLITLAAEWSPHRAISLMQWFAERGPIWYAEASAEMFQVLIEKRGLSPLKARSAIEWLLRFSTTPRSSLTESYIKSVYERSGQESALSAAQSLYEAIMIYALPTARPGWVHGIVAALEASGISPLPPMPTPVTRERDESGSAYEPTITLKDGSVLKGDALRQVASTVQGLRKIASEATNDSYGLTEHFSRVADTATRDELKVLSEAAASLKDQSLALSAISMRQSQAGDRNAAWDTASKALDRSRDYGWIRHGDGGTRVNALQALVAADPERGRLTALQMFASDLSKPRSYPAEIVHNLREISQLFSASVPVAKIWEELDAYLKTLCPGLEDASQPDLRNVPEDDSSDRAVTECLAQHLTHPVALLCYGAQHGLGYLLLEGDLDGIESIRLLLKSDAREEVTAAMGIVEAASITSIESIRAFSGELRVLTQHPAFPVWFTAYELLTQLGETQLPSRPRKTLPAIYDLKLPEITSVRSQITPETQLGEALPDPIDRLEAVATVEDDLNWVAELLGMSAAPLLHRVRQLMSEIRDDDQWSRAAEERLQHRLSGAELEFTYRRPRGQIARQALDQVLSELIDAGRIPSRVGRAFVASFKDYDPALLLARARRRPLEVRGIEGLDKYGHANEDWVNQVRTHEPQFTKIVGEFTVIGELLELRRLTWETPMVKIRSACIAGQFTELPDLWPKYEGLPIEGYPSINDPEDQEHLIIYKEYDGKDSDCGRWIAINPTIANAIGWIYSPEGFCKWNDSSGQVMAETIWWKDSTLDHRPYKEDEVGEGWLVVLSPEGLRSIEMRFPFITRITLSLRRATLDGTPVEGKSISIDELSA